MFLGFGRKEHWLVGGEGLGMEFQMSRSMLENCCFAGLEASCSIHRELLFDGERTKESIKGGEWGRSRRR